MAQVKWWKRNLKESRYNNEEIGRFCLLSYQLTKKKRVETRFSNHSFGN